ncbi:MAG TPA: GNAT family N-acetyltransferase [Paenalcaligenes sp.]|nr:GNAT family N-acetyltransferase [Paenalcaligenes sp.]
MIKQKTGSWNELASDAMAVRLTVFVHEQKVPEEIEQDDQDPLCTHLVVYNEHDQPIATGRLLPNGHIGRLAVMRDYRQQGLGAHVLQHLLEVARQQGHIEVELSARLSAKAFYEKAGFVAIAAPHMEAGAEHVRMRHVLTI